MGAMGKGDFVSARKHLDDHLSFQGPIEAFQKADPYLESPKKLHHNALLGRISAAAFIARPGKVLHPLGPKPDRTGPDSRNVANQIVAIESRTA